MMDCIVQFTFAVAVGIPVALVSGIIINCVWDWMHATPKA
jgi:ABC-type antimicrobial peptide transport system permease subunit